jgi:3-phenylpropionate/trans-cinnamate dioxygenase ferredoxin reductase component
VAGQAFRYVIVGGGMAGASAVKGIRQFDREGALLLMSAENHLPYNRPPLSKDLWFGRTTIEDIMAELEDSRGIGQVQRDIGARATHLDVGQRTVVDSRGNSYRYEKLLLATGGRPRTLTIPGGDLSGICYYRTLDDYLRIRHEIKHGKSALVIGGGFIGSEMAAALLTQKVDVTMIFPGSSIATHVFPAELAAALTDSYRERGIRILTNDVPNVIEQRGTGFVTRTRNGESVASDLVLVGVGLSPSVALARQAGLAVSNGIVVNAYLQTSNPQIYAAGDNALFHYEALGERRRVEHWDNAINQGFTAGRNMGGAGEAYSYMPYFCSDLFDFGYEAVGDIDASLETVTDWKEANKKGAIFYLRDGRVRGVMLCNVWGKRDAARELIRRAGRVVGKEIRGAIQF